MDDGERGIALEPSSSGVQTLGWTADGKWLATTSQRTINLSECDPGAPNYRTKAFFGHESDQRAPRGVLTGGGTKVWCAALSPDGNLAASSGSMAVKVWNPETLEELHDLTGHRHWVTSVAFSQDSSRLASSDMEGLVVLWDSRGGAAIQSWSFPGAVRVVGFSSRGELVVVDEQATVSVLPVPAAETPAGVSNSGELAPTAAPPHHPRIRRGCLEVMTILSKDDWNDISSLVFLEQDSDGGILAMSGEGAVYKVRGPGMFEIVTAGRYAPLRASGFGFRDPRSHRLLIVGEAPRSIYAAPDARAGIDRTGGEQRSVQSEREAEHASPFAVESPLDIPFLHVPDEDRTILVARREQGSAGTRLERQDRAVIDRQGCRLTLRLRSPDADRAVVMTRGEPRAIRRAGEALDVRWRRFDAHRLLAGLRIPSQDRPVRGGGDEPRSDGDEHRGAHRAASPFEHLPHPLLGRAPEAHGAILGGGCEQRSARLEGERGDLAGMTRQARDLAA